jgi:hypothetical protein
VPSLLIPVAIAIASTPFLPVPRRNNETARIDVKPAKKDLNALNAKAQAQSDHEKPYCLVMVSPILTKRKTPRSLLLAL